MSLRRVVVTGMGAVSPFGVGVEPLTQGLWGHQSGIRTDSELLSIKGLRTQVSGRVGELNPKDIPRRYRRSMSPLSVYAVLAGQEAAAQARLSETILAGGRLGVCIGTTVSSPVATQECYQQYLNGFTVEEIKGSLFFQIMNHSPAFNLAQVMGIQGRTYALSAACATGNQAVGLGFEQIACGRLEIMLCGGTEEFHPLTAGTFDIINAASTQYNDRPDQTPRPFDRDRDGVVCAEGAGVLVLELLESARQRGVPILAEILSFSTNIDSTNIADPNVDSIEACIREALETAGLEPAQVDYINAHATGTLLGDRAEAEAISRIFGDRVPVSSLKGHLGHTMAASGALEVIATIAMMQKGLLISTRNLDKIDPLCQGVYLLQEPKPCALAVAVKNNFGLGGVNSCTVLRRYVHD